MREILIPMNSKNSSIDFARSYGTRRTINMGVRAESTLGQDIFARKYVYKN